MSEYDDLAVPYHESKKAPFRVYLEEPAFRSLVGDVRGQAALDMACGEGHYTRMLARLGASPVVGVDISQGMVDLARAAESETPMGVTYVCAGAEQIGEIGSFPLVTAAYLFNCAPDLETLRQMWRNIASNLAPSGRFAAIYGALQDAVGIDLSRYGTKTFHTRPLDDGEAYRFDLWDGRQWFQLQNYAWRKETLERLAREAGLARVEWMEPVLDAAGRLHAPELESLPVPIFVGLSARRD